MPPPLPFLRSSRAVATLDLIQGSGDLGFQVTGTRSGIREPQRLAQSPRPQVSTSLRFARDDGKQEGSLAQQGGYSLPQPLMPLVGLASRVPIHCVVGPRQRQVVDRDRQALGKIGGKEFVTLVGQG